MKIIESLKGVAFEIGREVVRVRGTAVVGMSLGNSYFKKETIAELLRFCSENFSEVRIIIADKPAEHTYKAIGYSSKKARKKARLNGNTLIIVLRCLVLL